MTYCVGLMMNEGLVMLADTRTNAGVDNVSTYGKTYVWEKPDDRVVILMASGNLAITQAVVNLIDEGLPPQPGTDEEGPQTMYNQPSLFRIARLVGRAVRMVHHSDAEAMQAQGASFTASFLLAGQLADRTMRLFNVYAAGNFISAAPETPFLQIGENKYGKPILDRAFSYEDTDLEGAIKLALLSMDSTLRSNLSVGFPLDLVVYRRDSIRVGLRKRIAENDPYMQTVTSTWSEALRAAYHELPDPAWEVG